MSAESCPPAHAARPQRVVAWHGGRVRLQHEVTGPGGLQGDSSYSRVMVRSLMRAQLGLSLMCLVIALAITVSFPMVAALCPAVIQFRLLGLPLTLVVLGGGIYPFLLAIGWFYHRQARRLEARFVELVDPAERNRLDE